MFVQVFQGRCHDADRIRQVGDEWVDDLGPGATGWLGGTYGVTDDGLFVAVVRFASRAAAEANSTRPEQGEWWRRMEACFDGEVAFHDCDEVVEVLDGGSDDAGFVQVIEGTLSDPARFRSFMSQPMDVLREARPELIGGTVAIASDGWFAQTMAFRSESEARIGEKQGLPADLRDSIEEEMSVIQDPTYLDLHHPWFSSPGGVRLTPGGGGGRSGASGPSTASPPTPRRGPSAP